MAIKNLATHPAVYVTVAELAEYWAVSRKQILKRIESGNLSAIRLGARLYRIRIEAALDFERRTAVAAMPRRAEEGPTLVSSTPSAKAALQEIPRSE
jgi:excisionase family DNA binding protein